MKSKPITIIIISLILIAGISFFLIRPVVSSVWSSWNELNRTKEDLKNVDAKVKVLQDLKNNPNVNSVAQIALKYIPKESQAGELVIELTAMAQTNNLKVEETSLEKSKETSKSSEETTSPTPKSQTSPGASPTPSEDKTGGAKEIEFSMKLSGTYPDFMNFLRAVETSSRLIVIKNLSLQMATETVGTEQKSTFTAQTAGVAYYKSDVTVADALANIEISEDTLKKFLNLKTYGIPINLPTESGFGRTNPFENY